MRVFTFFRGKKLTSERKRAFLTSITRDHRKPPPLFSESRDQKIDPKNRSQKSRLAKFFEVRKSSKYNTMLKYALF